MSQTNQVHGEPIPGHLRTWITTETAGECDHAVAARIGLSRLALARAAAGFPVLRGTRALIEMAYLRAMS